MKNGPYEMVVAPLDYPGKRYRDRYCYEHHLVWWINHKELIPDGYEIHHKDRNRRNNAVDNLELLSEEKHNALHKREQARLMVKLQCPACGTVFYRRKRDVKKGAVSVCSKACRGRLCGKSRFIDLGFKQSVQEYKLWSDGRVEYPPYKEKVTSEFFRPMASELRKEARINEEKRVADAIVIGKPIYACKSCGGPRDKNAVFCSNDCATKDLERADWSNLKLLIEEHNSNWCAIARVLGVCDVAVIKKAKKYGLYTRKHKHGLRATLGCR